MPARRGKKWMEKTSMADRFELTSPSLRDLTLLLPDSTWADPTESLDQEVVEAIEEDEAEVTTVIVAMETDTVRIGDTMRGTDIIRIADGTIETDITTGQGRVLAATEEITTEPGTMTREDTTRMALHQPHMGKGPGQGHQVPMKETRDQEESTDLAAGNMTGDIERKRNGLRLPSLLLSNMFHIARN